MGSFFIVRNFYSENGSEGVWIKERKAYGNSGYPWNCPLSGKKIDYTHCCPRAEKAVDDHMILYIHEGWTEKEIDDTITALEKVEGYYLKQEQGL